MEDELREKLKDCTVQELIDIIDMAIRLDDIVKAVDDFIKSKDLNSIKDSDLSYGDKIRAIRNYENPTPDYYGEKCKCGRKIDWYVIGDLYRKNKGSAWEHAGKKLLRAGEGHKSLENDIKEVIKSLDRWLEQLQDKEGK